MKVYMNGYKDHWISPYTIVDYMFFWTKWSKCSRNKWIIKDEDWVETPKWADDLAEKLSWLSNSIRFIGDLFDRKIDYVKIDRWDSWSADYTLSLIILPVLKQLKQTKHGAPFTDDDDVPEELRSTNAEPKENEYDTDSNHFKRWDYIMDEVIWALEQHTKDDDESQFWDHSAYDLGKSGTSEWLDDMSKGRSKTKCDWDGLKAHQARKLNGFRLMGKYWTGFWD
jgi:hypothetical protein